MNDRDTIPTTEHAGWEEVVAVEREIRLMAYTSAGDPKLMDNMKMYAIWAGRLQKAIMESMKSLAILLALATTAHAQEVQVLGPIDGFACMNLALPDAQMRDPAGVRVSIVTEPRVDAPVGTLATPTVIVRSPLHVVNGFAEVLQLTGRPGWILARVLKPYSSSRPGARCTPSMLSNGRIGFGYG